MAARWVHVLIASVALSLGAAGCQAAYAQPRPGTPGCRFRQSRTPPRCSGVPPAPGERPPAPVDVCVECRANADCRRSARGRCVNTATVCSVGTSVCTYPGDPCYPSACAGGRCELRDGGRRHACVRTPLPLPPSAPPR